MNGVVVVLHSVNFGCVIDGVAVAFRSASSGEPRDGCRCDG